jgi:hypothetical protein
MMLEIKRIAFPPLRQLGLCFAGRGQKEILLEEIKRHREKSSANVQSKIRRHLATEIGTGQTQKSITITSEPRPKPDDRGLIIFDTVEPNSYGVECSRLFSRGVESVVVIGPAWR